MTSGASRRRKAARTAAARGRAIAEDPGRVKRKDNRRWKVLSESVAGLWYTVILGAAGIACSCPYHGETGGLCKHAVAVGAVLDRLWDAAGGTVRAGAEVRRLPEQCRRCRSRRFVRNGRRRNRRRAVQRHLCRSCGYSFSDTPGFLGRHVAPETVAGALKGVAYGLSPASVQRILAEEGILLHPCTIHRWVADYSSLMEGYARTLRPMTGFMWHCDETYFKILGQARWLFAVMDGRTRFVLSYDISTRKMGYDPLSLFAGARKIAGAAPWVFVTDGLEAFCGAARKAFWSRTGFRLVHVREIHLRGEFNNNNCHERLNGEFQERLRAARGLGAEDPALVRLMILHHNFFRPHGGIGGRTPAEAAGIRILGGDRWITFIQNAAMSAA